MAIRKLRTTYSVPPTRSVPIEVRAADDHKRALLERHRSVVENAARVTMTLSATGEHIPRSAKTIVGADVEVVVPLAGLVDIDAEKARISKQIAKTEKEIARVSKKLANPQFLDKAPDEVVAKERDKLSDEESRKQHLTDAEMATLRIKRDSFHGEWNYVFLPKKKR